MLIKKEYKRDPLKRSLWSKEYSQRLRGAALELLGNKCIMCGFADRRALQFDHINGNGHKDIKLITKFYIKSVLDSILNNEGKFQLLCANCNWIKRFENNENKKSKYI